MKPIYTAPAIKITNVEMRPLMIGSTGGGEQEYSKGHNSFWDSSFWGEEEDEKPMFQQPKSLWDD